MVNLFTTLLGIFKRLVSLSMALVPLLIFIILLHTRDIFYAVSDPSPFLRAEQP